MKYRQGEWVELTDPDRPNRPNRIVQLSSISSNAVSYFDTNTYRYEWVPKSQIEPLSSENEPLRWIMEIIDKYPIPEAARRILNGKYFHDSNG